MTVVAEKFCSDRVRVSASTPTHSARSGFEDVDEGAKGAWEAMPTAAVMMLTTMFLPACASWSNKSSSRQALGGLVDVWLMGLVLFAVLMAATVVARSKAQAIWIFALVGVPRALTTWILFALIGREVRKCRHAGTLNSLHNAAISAPQILAAAMCAVLFTVAKHFHVQNETVSAMLLASVASLVAAWRATELRSSVLHQDQDFLETFARVELDSDLDSPDADGGSPVDLVPSLIACL